MDPPIPGAQVHGVGCPQAFGDYELLYEISRGAMGVVYAARHRSLERVVALKTILAGRLASELEIERFLAEARAAARLRHPGIVPVHDFGAHEGQHYFTMELVEGRSLADLVKLGPVPPEEAARIVGELANAIQFAHEHGVVHRDLKPGNILMDAIGRVLVTDFGLAKELDADSSLTGSGDCVGTPAYMAPEQASGDGQRVGPAADVYGLGAVLYTLLSARPLFLSPTAMGTLRQVAEREPIPLRVLNPAIPRDLETICHECLHKLPERRYASARELAADLARWRAGEPIVARPVGRLERLELRARRRPGVAALVLALVLIFFAGAAGVIWQWRVAVGALREAQAAQAESVRANLAALRTASPEGCEYVLAALDRSDPRVLAELRARLDAADAAPTERARARLALVDADPTVLRGLLAALAPMGDDPRELALSTRVLRAAHVQLEPRAWGELLDELSAGIDDEASSDLCALLLAAVAPEDARWQRAAPRIIARVLDADALLVPEWEALLAPFPAPLIDALAARFGDPDSQRRRTCAALLARQVTTDPERLLALAHRGDELQLELLLAPLLARPDWLAPRLVDWLHEPEPRAAAPASGPERAAASASAPDPAALAAIHDSFGLVTEQFAFSPALSELDFHATCEALRAASYEPIRARPFDDLGQLRVAAIWKRGGRDFEVAWDLSRSELEARAEELRADGLFPRDVAALPAPAGAGDSPEPRYVALFDALAGQDREATFLFGSSPQPEVFEQAWLVERDRLMDLAYRPRTLQVSFRPGSGLALAGVWARGQSGVDFFEPPTLSVEQDTDALLPGYARLDLSAYRAPANGPLLYTSGLFEPDARHVTTTVRTTDAHEHLHAARELAARGGLPIAIATSPGNPHYFGSVWALRRPALEDRRAARRAQVRAAAALLRMDRGEAVWPLLTQSDDPSLRSQLIVSLARLSAPLATLAARIEHEADVSARRALLLTLAEAPAGSADAATRALVLAAARRELASSPDAGIHAAARLLLSRWDAETTAAPDPPQCAGFFLTDSGHELVAIEGPVELLQGSPGSDPGRSMEELPHRRRIPRSFAIGAREVTSGELAGFLAALPELCPPLASDPLAPPPTMTWFQAAAFCRWLSEREGLPEAEMCYPPLDQLDLDWAPYPDALERAGYRLPTEAEWEYACRAGANSAWSFGDDPALLPYFAHCRANSVGAPARGGRHLPNDLGLFDLHGNVREWTHEGWHDYLVRFDELVLDDVRDQRGARTPDVIALRGGQFDDPERRLRCAARTPARNHDQPAATGFRLARTLR